MLTSGHRGVPLPCLKSSSDEDFQLWWSEFCACLAVNELLNAALGVDKGGLPNTEVLANVNSSTDDDLKKLIKNNSMQQALHVSAFDEQSLLSFFHASQTTK